MILRYGVDVRGTCHLGPHLMGVTVEPGTGTLSSEEHVHGKSLDAQPSASDAYSSYLGSSDGMHRGPFTEQKKGSFRRRSLWS
jgi:hypothetical protein